MIIKGKMVGIPMFGDCNEEEMRNIVELYQAVENLEKAITKVFDENVATIKIQSLGECELQVCDGKMPQNMNEQLKANGWKSSRANKANPYQIVGWIEIP